MDPRRRFNLAPLAECSELGALAFFKDSPRNLQLFILRLFGSTAMVVYDGKWRAGSFKVRRLRSKEK
jgi:hypothetical protein